MKFKKYICLKGVQIYNLAEPVTINNSDRFVKVKYKVGTSKHERQILENIINCNYITNGI